MLRWWPWTLKVDCEWQWVLWQRVGASRKVCFERRNLSESTVKKKMFHIESTKDRWGRNLLFWKDGNGSTFSLSKTNGQALRAGRSDKIDEWLKNVSEVSPREVQSWEWRMRESWSDCYSKWKKDHSEAKGEYHILPNHALDNVDNGKTKCWYLV